ncbi:MAG: FAD-dependent oxidoreductase [Planctomycetota bacterium]
MRERLSTDRSEAVFDDYKKAYSPGQARTEASRCLFCHDAPCIAACPTEINIPQFIRKIATGNLTGSARTIFDANILGMSCARVCPVEVLCVGDCVYNHMDVPPIQIGKLQRYATDLAFERGQRFAVAGPESGKSVALVGAGPASLAAAHELRRLGHACTIYEKRTLPGGLNTTGVAPYKMKSERGLDEVEWVLGIGGIELKTGVAVGEEDSFEDLEERHDAVFLGMGLGPDTALSVPGEDLDGVCGAVEFIEALKLGEVDLSKVKTCAVIGAGNTAVDVVRELLGLGASDVVMIYRGEESQMSGYAHEWQVAMAKGARAMWSAQVSAFEGKERLLGMTVVNTDGQRQPIAGTETHLAVDLALLAIGQSKLGAIVASLENVEVERGRIVTDEFGRTGRSGIFAGGDCRNGGKEVVNAVAEGKAAARAIDEFLRSEASCRI